MKLLKLALCSAVASVAVGGAAMAQDVAVTGNVGITSDYIFRGVSQTNTDPAIQGGVDVASGPFYAGLWASNVAFTPWVDITTGALLKDTTDAEIDAYVGVKPQFGGFNFDFAAIYYGYIDTPDFVDVDYNYWEAKAGVSRAFGPLTLGGAVYYSPEFTLEQGEAWYIEGNAAYAFNDQWSVSGAVGNQKFEDLDFDYTTWNLGVSWAFAPHLTVDLRYFDTEEDFKNAYEFAYAGTDSEDNASEKLVVGIKAVFP